VSTPPLAVAGVDVGSNSLILTVARPGSEGLHILEERYVITRLGEGLADGGPLSREAMDRTLRALEEFGVALASLGAEARVAGTSALRRASNAESFIEQARDVLGFPVNILSGPEEARLSYRGALSDLGPELVEESPVVIDPGGGSTEVYRSGDQGVSLELGAVRLTEAFLRSDPPSPEERAALEDHIDAELAMIGPAERSVVAVGGGVTTLAALSTGLRRYDSSVVHGFRLASSEVARLADWLAGIPLDERKRIPCLPAGRADIIVAGALVLVALLERLGVEHAVVSDRGLRFGLIAELLDGYPPTTQL
jgi:exopolyphosphatase/guanosine-5'-triphosphate,3'-diphosphate pyrophosphatase